MTPRPDYGEESYQGHGRLQGKVALITGGDSGIGRAVALAFAREGADVLISYLNEDSDAEETARVVREAGRQAVLAPGDISEESHCRSLVERTVAELGRLDILVNNAAYQMTREGIEQIPEGEWEHTFKTNIFAMYYLCQAAWPHCSPAARSSPPPPSRPTSPRPRSWPMPVPRGPSSPSPRRWPRRERSRGFGSTWWRRVRSGPRSSRPPCRRRKPSSSGRIRRWDAPRQPAELAPLFVFLASHESSYITGEVVGVTGGKPLV